MALVWARWFLALRRQEANLGIAILWSTSWKIINNQLQVMRRFKYLFSKDVRARLYKAFVLPYFQYCSAVWHCCGVRSSDKLEAMRLIFNDFTSNYSFLLNELESDFVSLRDARIQDMLTLLYKCFLNLAPFYLTSLFHVRKYYPRGNKSSLCLRWHLLLLDLTLFNT